MIWGIPLSSIQPTDSRFALVVTKFSDLTAPNSRTISLQLTTCSCILPSFIEINRCKVSFPSCKTTASLIKKKDGSRGQEDLIGMKSHITPSSARHQATCVSNHQSFSVSSRQEGLPCRSKLLWWTWIWSSPQWLRTLYFVCHDFSIPLLCHSFGFTLASLPVF